MPKIFKGVNVRIPRFFSNIRTFPTETSLGSDGQTKVWSLPTGDVEWDFRPHQETTKVRLSPDGELLATFDGYIIKVWSVADNEAISTLEGTPNLPIQGV